MKGFGGREEWWLLLGRHTAAFARSRAGAYIKGSCLWCCEMTCLTIRDHRCLCSVDSILVLLAGLAWGKSTARSNNSSRFCRQEHPVQSNRSLVSDTLKTQQYYRFFATSVGVSCRVYETRTLRPPQSKHYNQAFSKDAYVLA